MLELSHRLACSNIARWTQKNLYPSRHHNHDVYGNLILENNIIHLVKIIVCLFDFYWFCSFVYTSLGSLFQLYKCASAISIRSLHLVFFFTVMKMSQSLGWIYIYILHIYSYYIYYMYSLYIIYIIRIYILYIHVSVCIYYFKGITQLVNASWNHWGPL